MNETSPNRAFVPWFVILLIVFFIVGSCSLTVWTSLDRTFSFLEGFNPRVVKSGKLKKGAKSIVQFNITGVIYGTREDLFDSLDEIEAGVKDNKVAGVLVYVDSPGGSVAPTQDIYRRILEIRKKIPVICSFGDLAASGGYYLATACEEIFALPGTTTGSIGVIFELFNVENLMAWAKVKPITIKAGKLKDIASPFRAMTPEEKVYLQNLLDQVHEQFIRDVAKGRAKKISESDLRQIADGRVFTGEQALKLGLVDKEGGPHEAMNFLRKDKKLGDDLEVLKLPRPKRSFESLFTESKASDLLDKMRLVADPLSQSFNGLVPMLLPSYFQVR